MLLVKHNQLHGDTERGASIRWHQASNHRSALLISLAAVIKNIDCGVLPKFKDPVERTAIPYSEQQNEDERIDSLCNYRQAAAVPLKVLSYAGAHWKQSVELSERS